MFEMYFKLCTLCGFMAPFSPIYLKVNRWPLKNSYH
jgi:hypothetical protein